MLNTHNNTITKRLYAAAIKSIAFALFAFLGVISMPSARAIPTTQDTGATCPAQEVVSDATLSNQEGAASFYSGTCNMHSDDPACTITASPGVPAYSTACAVYSTQYNYHDVRHGYEYCSGNNLNGATTGPCRRDLSAAYAIERRYYSNVTAQTVCVEPGQIGANY